MSVEADHGDLACPQCRRIDQVAAVPAVCNAGTSSYAGRSDAVSFGSGMAFGAGGAASAYGVSRSVGWQSGTIQTNLAAVLAPAPRPFARTERGTCLSALVFFVAFPVWVIWFLSIWIKASKRNKRVERGRPEAVEVWARAWYCFRCGGAFIPASTSRDLAHDVPRDSLLPPVVFQRLVWTAGGYQDLLGIAG